MSMMYKLVVNKKTFTITRNKKNDKTSRFEKKSSRIIYIYIYIYIYI